MSQTATRLRQLAVFLSCVAIGSVGVIAFAMAQAPVAAPTPTNFTPVVVAIIGGLFTVVSTVGVALINSRMKDTQAATVLSNALTASVGVANNAVKDALTSHPLQATIPGISPSTAAAVQYTLDHAGDEAARFGITPAALAEKVEARVGLQTAPAANS